MHIVHVEDHLDFVIDMVARAWINAGHKVVLAGLQIDEDFVPHQFGDIHDGFHRLSVDAGRGKLWVVDIFWADAKDDLFADIAA